MVVAIVVGSQDFHSSARLKNTKMYDNIGGISVKIRERGVCDILSANST